MLSWPASEATIRHSLRREAVARERSPGAVARQQQPEQVGRGAAHRHHARAALTEPVLAREPAHERVLDERRRGGGVERVHRLVRQADGELARDGGDQRRGMQMRDGPRVAEAQAAVEHAAQVLQHPRQRRALRRARIERACLARQLLRRQRGARARFAERAGQRVDRGLDGLAQRGVGGGVAVTNSVNAGPWTSSTRRRRDAIRRPRDAHATRGTPRRPRGSRTARRASRPRR